MAASISNVTVRRAAPTYGIETSAAETGDLSIVVHNPAAFATAAELTQAMATAVSHVAAQLGLK